MQFSAAAASSSGSNIALYLVFAVLIGGFFYMQSRTRKRASAQQSAMRSNLEPGATVTTIGGIKGTVAHADADQVGVEVSPGVVINFLPRAIADIKPAASRQIAPDDQIGRDGKDDSGTTGEPS